MKAKKVTKKKQAVGKYIADSGITLQQNPWQQVNPNDMDIIDQQRTSYMNSALQNDPVAQQQMMVPNMDLQGVTPDSPVGWGTAGQKPKKQGSKFGLSTTDLVSGALTGLNALIPYKKGKTNQNLYQQSPQINPYGTNSQATYEDGGIVKATSLSKAQEGKYQKWKGGLPKNLQYEGDYDLRGFYKENPNFNVSDPTQHLTDKFKLPNHPTFSNESQYFQPYGASQPNIDSAGYWNNNTYLPYNPTVKDTVQENMYFGGKADNGITVPNYQNNWNDFQTHLAKLGIAGSPDLDHGAFSNKLITDYNNSNPATQITPDYIKKVQGDFVSQPGASKNDGWLGSITSQYKYPQSTDVPGTQAPQKQQRGVRYEKLHDTMGNQYYSPIPTGNYSKHEWEDTVRQLPEKYDNTPVMKGDTYNEMFVKGDYNTDQWKTAVDKPQSFPQLGNPQQLTSIATQQVNPQPVTTPTQKKKSSIKVNYNDSVTGNFAYGGVVPMNGGQVQVENNNFEMLSPNTMKLTGNSHDQQRADGSTGTDISANGTQIEAEKNETVHVDNQGNTIIGGNLQYPGTNTKFKSIFEDMGKQEKKVDRTKNKASYYLNNFDPHTDYSSYAFNAGKVMSDAYEQKNTQLQAVKQHVTDVQQQMLDIAEQTGTDPGKISKFFGGKAKYGITLPKAEFGDKLDGENSQTGKLSLAQRHNNPGNIKYGDFAKRFGAVKGEPATDGGFFAKFPDLQSGKNAIGGLLKTNNYKNLSVKDAANRWTGGAGYKNIPPDLAGKKISQLSPDEFNRVRDTITVGEDSKHYNWNDGQQSTPVTSVQAQTPYANTIVGNYDIGPQTNFYPVQQTDQSQNPQSVSTDTTQTQNTEQKLAIVKPKNEFTKPLRNNFRPLDYLGEASAIFDHAEPVPSIQVNPILEQEYQTSFQNQKNAILSAYNPSLKAAVNNPAIQAGISGELADRLANVDAQELQYNQQNNQGTRARNLQELRGVRDINTQLTSDQMNKQAATKANVQDNRYRAIESIAGKEAQRSAANNQLAMQEKYAGWQFDKDGNIHQLRPDYMFAPQPLSSVPDPADAKKTKNKTKTTNGNTETTTETTSYFGGMIASRKPVINKTKKKMS